MDRIFIIIHQLFIIILDNLLLQHLLIIMLPIINFIIFKNYTKPIKLTMLKIKKTTIVILFLTLLVLFNFFLFMFRIRNIGKTIDFFQQILKLKNILLIHPTLIFLICNIIIIFILVILLLKKLLFLLFLKINFFIINLFLKKDNNFYEKIKQKYIGCFMTISLLPANLLIILLPKKEIKILKIIHRLVPFYGVIILIFIFFIEIFFNNGKLYYFFFWLPFMLIYQILYSLYIISGLTYDIEEKIICYFLYDTTMLIINDEYYISGDGIKFTKNDLDEINCFVENNFDRVSFYYNYIKKYKKKPSIS